MHADPGVELSELSLSEMHADPGLPFAAGRTARSEPARSICVCRERAVGRRRARVVGRRKNATREAKTTFVVRNRLGDTYEIQTTVSTRGPNRAS